MSHCVLHSYLLSVNKTLQGLGVFLELEQSFDTWASESWLLPRPGFSQQHRGGGSEKSKAAMTQGSRSPRLSKAKPSLARIFTLHAGTSLRWPCRAQQFSEHLRAKELSNLALTKSTAKRVRASNPAMSGLHPQCKHALPWPERRTNNP